MVTCKARPAGLGIAGHCGRGRDGAPQGAQRVLQLSVERKRVVLIPLDLGSLDCRIHFSTKLPSSPPAPGRRLILRNCP